MRKIISIFIVLLLSITSCNKEILDKAPLDIITDDVVWNDQALIDAYLTNAYLKMYVFDNENDHHVSASGDHFTIFMTTSVSDEARSNHTWAGNANAFKNGGLKINGGLMEWWESAYSVIRVLNEFIQRVPSAPVDEQFRTARTAEARFLRAYAYFCMVKRYGGVPLITTAREITAPQDSLYPKRATEQAVYDFVLSECDAIAGILPENPTADYGRPTRYAALALKCRAALYAASIAKFGAVQLDGILGIDAAKSASYYQQAFDAADVIIKSEKYALYNKYPDDKILNFRNIFLDENDNPEKIFVKPHDGISSDQGGGGWTYDFMQCPTPNAWGQGNNDGPYLEMAEAFEHVDGSSGKLDYNALENNLWTTDQLWANKDSRFYASIYTMNTAWQGIKLDNHNGIVKSDGTITTDSYNGIRGTGPSVMKTGFGVLKYLDENHDNQGETTNSQVDWIIFRYGEILLNYAEAAFNLNKPDIALDAVNQIRNRAGIATLVTIDSDKIRQERRVELAFEGHRYWDLRRWRTAETVLSVNRSGLRYIHDYNTGKLKLSVIKDIDGTVSVPAFYAHNYYFPITLSRTGINKNLVENPGY